MGKGVWGGEEGKREIIYLSLHCHHLNDSCIKMGSDTNTNTEDIVCIVAHEIRDILMFH